MKRISLLLVVVLALGAVGVWAGEHKCGKSEDVALDQVPANVLAAAKEAVPGIELTEAELKQWGEKQVYELEGTVGDKEYEVKVSADGKVIKAKAEGDEEGEGHGKKSCHQEGEAESAASSAPKAKVEVHE